MQPASATRIRAAIPRPSLGLPHGPSPDATAGLDHDPASNFVQSSRRGTALGAPMVVPCRGHRDTDFSRIFGPENRLALAGLEREGSKRAGTTSPAELDRLHDDALAEPPGGHGGEQLLEEDPRPRGGRGGSRCTCAGRCRTRGAGSAGGPGGSRPAPRTPSGRGSRDPSRGRRGRPARALPHSPPTSVVTAAPSPGSG